MNPTPTADATMLGLEGSVALVTGAGRGLAKAAAVMLARAGAVERGDR